MFAFTFRVCSQFVPGPEAPSQPRAPERRGGWSWDQPGGFLKQEGHLHAPQPSGRCLPGGGGAGCALAEPLEQWAGPRWWWQMEPRGLGLREGRCGGRGEGGAPSGQAAAGCWLGGDRPSRSFPLWLEPGCRAGSLAPGLLVPLSPAGVEMSHNLPRTGDEGPPPEPRPIPAPPGLSSPFPPLLPSSAPGHPPAPQPVRQPPPPLPVSSSVSPSLLPNSLPSAPRRPPVGAPISLTPVLFNTETCPDALSSSYAQAEVLTLS